jgi:hypothetical protein
LLHEYRNEAYESARLFKEKVKIWHDKQIKIKECKVGDQVLLFNSRFMFSAGKLMYKWHGPLGILEVYRSRAIRIQGDIRGKPHVVNGHHLKQYIAGETFVRKVEVVHFQTLGSVVSSKFCLPELENK